MIPNIILMGPPGSGKGSFAGHLRRKKGYQHVCSGDLLRDQVESSTPIGKKIEEMMREGGRVPDEVITTMVIDKITEMQNARIPFVLDGFPQTAAQKAALDRFRSDHKESQFTFISIHVDPKTALERMTKRISCLNCHEIFNLATKQPVMDGLCDLCGTSLRQRESDCEEKARKRLELFERTTKTVVDLYEKEDSIQIVNGNLPQEEIYKTYGEG